MVNKRLKIVSSILIGLAVWLTLTLSAVAEERSFLWQVEDQQGHVAYLMGSIHMARPDLYPLAPILEEAYQRSQVLVVEADINRMDMPKVQKKVMATGVYPKGQTLSKHLSPATMAAVEEAGLDLKVFDKFRPWLVAIEVQNQKLKALGFDQQYGLDKHFLDQAVRDKKTIKELEGVDYQFYLFQRLTPMEQDQFLYYSLLEAKTLDTDLPALIKAWKSGDDKAFGQLFFKGFSDHPELLPLADKLIFRRNEKMLIRIKSYLRSGRSHFIIVGAGHLVGPLGLVNRLMDEGYKVSQL